MDNFFKFIAQVKESRAFQMWRETLCAELTGTQNQILRGPAWSGRDPKQMYDPLEARVNVACVGKQTVNRRLAESTQVSTEPEIQVPRYEELFFLFHGPSLV